MKANKNFKLAYLPEGTSFAKNSILVHVNCDIMESKNKNSIPNGSVVIASPVAYDKLDSEVEYVIIDTSNNIFLGRPKTALNSGITLQPSNSDYPDVFLHCTLLKSIYEITDVYLKRGTE